MGEGPFFPPDSSTLEKIALIGSLQQQFGPRGAIGPQQFVQQQLTPPRGAAGRAGVLGALAIASRGKGKDDALEEQRRQVARRTQLEIDQALRQLQGSQAFGRALGEQISQMQGGGEVFASPLTEEQQSLVNTLRAGQIAAQSGAPVLDVQRMLQAQQVPPGTVAQIQQRQAEEAGRERRFVEQLGVRRRAVSAQERQATAAERRAGAAEQRAQAEQAARQAMQDAAQAERQRIQAEGRQPNQVERMVITGLEAGEPRLISTAARLRNTSELTKEAALVARSLNIDPRKPVNQKDAGRIINEIDQRENNRVLAQTVMLRRDAPIETQHLGLWMNPDNPSLKLAPPVTPRQAQERGFIMLDAKSREDLRILQVVKGQLNDLKALAFGGTMRSGREITSDEAAFVGIPQGIWQRAFSGANLAYLKAAQTGKGATAAQFQRTMEALIRPVGQAAARENNRFSNEDANRLMGIFPQTGTLRLTGIRFPDSESFARNQMEILDAQIADFEQRALGENSFVTAVSPTITTLPDGTQIRILP